MQTTSREWESDRFGALVQLQLDGTGLSHYPV